MRQQKEAEEKRLEREEMEEKLRLQTERENEEKAKHRREAEDRLRLQRENQTNISR